MIFKYSKAFVFTVLAVIAFSCGRQIEEKAPNIILFLVDDMGWEDSSVPFWKDSVDNNRYMKTINISRLAKEGMKFTNAYAASPVCSPTRSSILTGMNPAHTHITNWIPGRGDHPETDQKLMIPHWRINGLDQKDVTLPQLLKDHGYVTAHIGKAHLGNKNTIGADPCNLGFDISIAASHRGGPGSYYVPYGDPAKNDSQMLDLKTFFPDSLYLNDALTMMALQTLDSLAKDPARPFYLNMWHYAVHAPIQGDPELIDKFRIPGKSESQAQYASMIESTDRSLGKILQKLNELGIEKNTIIIFMSDNGGLVSHSGPPTDNYPLSSGKGSSHEGGYREPMIVKWPGNVKPGTVCDVPVITDDFLPTILSMAKARIPDTLLSKLDGVDITPLLLQIGMIQRPHPLIWHYPHYWGWKELRVADTTITPFSAIREGNWKLIYTYEKGQFELYNLADDISEKYNMVKEKPEIARRLSNDLRKTLEQMDAQTPIDRDSGNSLPLPEFEKIVN